jgi:hypothetical protein
MPLRYAAPLHRLHLENVKLWRRGEEVLLHALGVGLGVDQSLEDGEHVAAVFDQSRENVAKGRLALGHAMPFEQHRLGNFNVAAELFGGVPTQEQAVEESRLALREVEVVLGLFDRLGCGWYSRVGIGLHLHLHLKTEKAVYRKFSARQVVPSSRVAIFAMSAAKRPGKLGWMPEAGARILCPIPRTGISLGSTSTIKIWAELSRLARLARRSNEFAQSRNIGSVGPDAGRIDRQTQALGSLDIDSGIVEFGQAKPNRWKHTLFAARVHWTRRTMALPRAVRDREELVPIVLVPHQSLPRPRDSGRSKHSMRQIPTWSLPVARRGQTSGIRHNFHEVHHRLGNVSPTLRKSNYQVAINEFVKAQVPMRSSEIGIEAGRRFTWNHAPSRSVSRLCSPRPSRPTI